MTSIYRIDIGDDVLCDFCGDDYTHSPAQGGIVFGSRAVCPKCAPDVEKNAARFNETKFIRGRCPAGKTFADWVREELR